MFKRNLFHVWFSIVILPCMVLGSLQGCGTDDDGGDGASLPRERIVFVSPEGASTLLYSLQGADNLCQGWAEGCGLPGTYKAWLSSSTASPSTRFNKDGEFRRVDGVLVAEDWADLTDGTLQAAINRDCANVPIDDFWPTYVSTGTNVDGTTNPNNCLNWTSQDTGSNKLVGGAASTSSDWTSYSTTPCGSGSLGSYLYCFQQ